MARKKDLKQKELINEVLTTAKSSATLYFLYSKKAKEFLPGHPTYMREANFLEIIQTGKHKMSEVARSMEVSQGAATQIADRLEKKEFIRRFVDKDDKRCIYVELTDLGHQVADAFEDYWEKTIVEEMQDHLSEYTNEDLLRIANYETKKKNLWESLIQAEA